MASCVPVPRLVEPKAPVSVYSVRFEGGSMALPANAAMDWYGVVLRGSLDVEGCGKLGPWHAYRIRGGGADLHGLADVVFGVAADSALGGPQAPQSGTVGRCERVDLRTLPEVTWANGGAHARMIFRDGRAYFGLLYSDPEVSTPLHTHPVHWEVVHVLRGSGEVTAGDWMGPLVAGSAYAFAPAEAHGFKSEWGSPTVAVQMYSPPGPEARFLELAKP